MRLVQELERARFAYDVVRQVTTNGGKFKALVRRAASDVQVNGLAQTLAFWKAKGEAHHRALLNAVSKWTAREIGLPPDTDLLHWLTQGDRSSVQYRRATASVLQLLVWLKRFAEAEIAESARDD